MLGALMASVETRPQYFVYLAANPVLTNWYTLGKKSPTHDQYVAAMAKFDILAALRTSRPQAVLMQFSAHDGEPCWRHPPRCGEERNSAGVDPRW